jgi:hypothetical protein
VLGAGAGQAIGWQLQKQVGFVRHGQLGDLEKVQDRLTHCLGARRVGVG